MLNMKVQILKEKNLKSQKNIFSVLKINTSVGYGGISSNVIIKWVLEEIFGILIYVLDLSINQDVLTESMKITYITPIFKSSHELLLTNYRPISVLPCF